MKTETKKTTTKKAPARKVRATKKPAPIAVTALTEKEKADAFMKNKKATGLTLFAHMEKGMKKAGYGSIKGAHMGAYTVAMMEALGYVTVSPTGNCTATRKQISRADIASVLGSSMATYWHKTTGRIENGKLTQKGLRMLNTRNKGESMTQDGQGTTCATKLDLIKLYRAWIKNGKGSKTVPFTPFKIEGLTK